MPSCSSGDSGVRPWCAAVLLSPASNDGPGPLGTLGVYLLKHTANRNGVMRGSAILRARAPADRRYSLLHRTLAGCNSDDAARRPRTSSPAARDALRAEDRAGARHAGRREQVGVAGAGPAGSSSRSFRDQAEKRKGEVAFIGVNSNDNRGDAEEFLKEEPVPFKHFEDPKLEIAAAFNAVQAFPSTAFYDSKGELAFVHQGAVHEREAAGGGHRPLRALTVEVREARTDDGGGRGARAALARVLRRAGRVLRGRPGRPRPRGHAHRRRRRRAP